MVTVSTTIRAPVRRDVLWSATLGAAPLPARIEAAVVNGYRGLTVRPDEVGHRAALAAARHRGLEHVIVEAVMDWYDHEQPPSTFPSTIHSLDEVLRAAEAFGSTDVHVVAPFRTRSETLESLTARFVAVCDRAADIGARAHLEFTPLPPIASLAAAWRIVRDADRPNAGIVLDTWHFFRGTPDLDLLASIPGERIMSVQVNDGAAGLVESLVKDTFRHRLAPGHGVFDLVGLLTVLGRTGGLNLVGPEVLSVDLDGVPPVEVARRVGVAFDAVMATAGAVDAPVATDPSGP